MEFTLTNIQDSVNGLMRKIGYTPAYFQNEGEYSLVRKLAGSDYPRFHLYIKEIENGFQCNLHLDQKKPSYEGSAKHSGEYDGPVVTNEAARIKSCLT